MDASLVAPPPAAVQTPEAAGDTVATVPESLDTLEAQFAALMQPASVNPRGAVFVPNESLGTVRVPAGQGIAIIPLSEGVLYLRPSKAGIGRQDALTLYRTGRLGQVLGLGDFTKADVAESAARGNEIVAVTERDQNGTEVRAAVGTSETAPAQQQAFEETAGEGGTVQVEDPAAVISDRLDALEQRDVPSETARAAEGLTEQQAAEQQRGFEVVTRRRRIGPRAAAVLGRRRTQSATEAEAGAEAGTEAAVTPGVTETTPETTQETTPETTQETTPETTRETVAEATDRWNREQEARRVADRQAAERRSRSEAPEERAGTRRQETEAIEADAREGALSPADEARRRAAVSGLSQARTDEKVRQAEIAGRLLHDPTYVPEEYTPVWGPEPRKSLVERLRRVMDAAREQGFEFAKQATYDVNTDAVVWLHEARSVFNKLDRPNPRMPYREINSFLMNEQAARQGDGRPLREKRIAEGRDLFQRKAGDAENAIAPTVDDLRSAEEASAGSVVESPVETSISEKADIGPRVPPSRRQMRASEFRDYESRARLAQKQLERMGLTYGEVLDALANEPEVGKRIVEQAERAGGRTGLAADEKLRAEIAARYGATGTVTRGEQVQEGTQGGERPRTQRQQLVDEANRLLRGGDTPEGNGPRVHRLGIRSERRSEDGGDLFDPPPDLPVSRGLEPILSSRSDTAGQLVDRAIEALAQSSDSLDQTMSGLFRLLRDSVSNTEVHVLADPDMNRFVPNYVQGYFNPHGDYIVLRESTAVSPDGMRIFLHESSHVVFEAAMEGDPALQRRVGALMDAVRTHAEARGRGEDYGFTNPSEFLAEVWSSEEFRALLGEIRIDPALRRQLGITGPQNVYIRNVLQWIKTTLARVLRIPSMISATASTSALRASIDLAGQVLEMGIAVRNQMLDPRTSSFGRWFEGSAVIDSVGRPRVVYHWGSFDPQVDIPRAGMHFGTIRAAQDRVRMKPHEDAQLAVTAYEADGGGWHFQLEDGTTSEDLGLSPVSVREDAVGDGRSFVRDTYDLEADPFSGNTTPVYLSIKNPKRVVDQQTDQGWAAAIERARDEGHDGLVYRNRFEDPGSDSYVAFEPAQIKSVFNRGTFNPNRGNIHHSERPRRVTLQGRLEGLGLPKPQAREVAQMVKETYGDTITDAELASVARVVREETARVERMAREAEKKTIENHNRTLGQLRRVAETAAEKAEAAAQRAFIPNKNPGRPRLLKILQNDQIARLADRWFGADNPVRRIQESMEQRRVLKARIMAEVGPVIDKLDAARRRHTPQQWQEFEQLTRDVRMANAHPDRSLADNTHLEKNSLGHEWSRAQHAALAARFGALPSDLKKLYAEARDTFTDTQNEMTRRAISNILRAAGVTDAGVVQRFHEGTATTIDRAAVGENVAHLIERAEELRKIDGPYFPLTRRGSFVVRGSYQVQTPAGATRLADNRFEFRDEKTARNWARSQPLRATLQRVYVDQTTGSEWAVGDDGKRVRVSKNDDNSEARYRATVQTQHLEMTHTRREALRRQGELREAGLKVKDIEPRQAEHGSSNDGMLSDNMRAIMQTVGSRFGTTDLDVAQQNELRAVLNEISLRFLGSTRIQTSQIPTRYVEGASTDLTRNMLDYVDSASGYIARLRTQPDLEQALQSLEERIQLLSGQDRGAGEGARMIANEMERRVYRVPPAEDDGKLRESVNRFVTMSFIDNLATPGYSLVNSTQVAMFTFPALAGDFGAPRAVAAITRAYKDIGAANILGGGLADTGRAAAGTRVTGDRFIDEVKSRLPEPRERAMMDHLALNGLIDADGGLEIARALDIRKDTLGGVVDTGIYYFDNIARALPSAIEAINRSVTAVSSYRMHYARNKDHEAALRYAADMVANTQALMSNSNSAPIFSHPIGRISLQFKKFPQMVYHFMGSNIGRIMRPMKKGDRVAGLRTMAYFLAMHQLIAGSVGLPWEPLRIASTLYSGIASGLGYEDWDWERFREEIERFHTAWAGEDMGEVLTYGVTRAIPGGFGFDLSSRLGLEGLLVFGEPRNDTRMGWEAYAWNTVAGPPGRMVSDAVQGANSLISGDPSRMGGLIPFKMLSDISNVYHRLDQGRMNYQDAALRVFGVTSARQMRLSTELGREIRENRRGRDARIALEQRWMRATTGAGRTRATAEIRRYNASLPPGERRISVDSLRRREREQMRRYQE